MLGLRQHPGMVRYSSIRRLVFLLVMLLLCPFGIAQESKPKPKRIGRIESTQGASTSLAARTLGGKQFWTDHFLHGGWRIQRNALTKHFRLLDDQNRRHASGEFNKCYKAFVRISNQQEIEPLPSTVTILLHGLADSRNEMGDIASRLRTEYDHFVMSMTYSSTRDSIDVHARAFTSVLEHLGPDVKRINLVGYSLGNLVLRRYWAMAQDSPKPVDRRIQRLVMLGPPNHGAQLAMKLGKRNLIYQAILGQTGRELGEDWEKLESRLAVPPCEFGIIAGNGRRIVADNPFIAGEDDSIVRVDETRLAGANDFTVLPVNHSKLPHDKTVIEYTARFLESGYFVSAEERHPLRR